MFRSVLFYSRNLETSAASAASPACQARCPPSAKGTIRHTISRSWSCRPKVRHSSRGQTPTQDIPWSKQNCECSVASSIGICRTYSRFEATYGTGSWAFHRSCPESGCGMAPPCPSTGLGCLLATLTVPGNGLPARCSPRRLQASRRRRRFHCGGQPCELSLPWWGRRLR